MEKKIMRKAAARRLSATLMALVLLVAAITPAGEAFASEFDFGGGIFDAVKSVEETQPAQQSEAPEFDFGGGKEEAQEELPVYVPTATEPPVTETDKMESVGDTAETLNAADVTVEQGGTVRYSLSYAGIYTYSVSPAASGLTTQAGGYGNNAYVTISAAEDVAAGIYTITYSRNGSSRGTFTVEVTAPETDEDEGVSDVGTPEIEETQKMTMDKVATEILDENGKPTGKYDLSLALSGSIGSQTNKAKVDVIFIVDNSNSMYDSNRYMQSLRPAMQALIDNLSTTNSEKIDARYAIAMFGTNSEIRQNFTDAATARTRVGNISQYSSQNGGTNYEAGIYQGKLLLNSVREGATSIVIFVTDGKPTFRGAPNKTGGNGQDDDERGNEGANIEAAVNQISSMNCNYFYCIGIGNNFTNSSTEEYQNMLSLTGAVNAETTGIHSVSSTNVSALTSVFNNISAEVTSFLCSNVTITDTLSNVDGELVVQVSDPSSVMVEVIKDGTTIAGPAASVKLTPTESNNFEAELTATYSNGVLKLDFPDAYKLEAGYTYKLHAIIEPTEKAYQEYREKGYTDTGDAGTGTHAGESGIYCNESATVTYDYQDKKDQVAYYAHPVIQLHPADLTITKQIVDMDVAVIETVEFPIVLTAPDGSEQTNTIKLAEFAYDEETDTYTLVLENLSPNTSYSITETGGEVSGYAIETTVNGVSTKDATGTLEMDESEVVAYINKYVKTDEDLEEGEGTISIRGEKLWDDNDNASQLRPESITVKLQGFDGTNWVDIQTVEVTPDAEGKWEFSVDVSSYAYLEYRFEETVPEYYEVIYEQPTYEFEYPAAGEWDNQTSCSELNISSSIDAKTIVVSKKGSDFVIWSYDALTPGEQQLIIDSFSQVDKSFKPENTTFFYGVGSSVLGMTVTEDKITYLNPNKWSYVYVGTYSRGSETATSGTITNKLASTDVTVTKDVSGNLGDRSLNFQFIATLSSGAFAPGDGYTVSDDGMSVSFDLKHAESVVLKNVPLGADLTIVEENSGYSVTVKVGETEYQNGDPIKVVPDMQIDFFNHLSEGVETGISLDSVPYIMMLVIAGAAFFFVMLRKRMAYED